MKLSQFTLPQFSAETAADKAVPGGGCVAALSGNLGASLIEMVGHMTERKAKKLGETFDAEVQKALEIATKEKEAFLQLIDQDAAAFDGCMQAFALPKATEEEKAVRKAAIQKAYQNATVPPYTVATKAVELMECARIMVLKGDQNALSDACVGTRMLVSAAWGGIYNVKINLSAITDEAFVAKKSEEVAALEARLETYTHDILDHVSF